MWVINGEKERNQAGTIWLLMNYSFEIYTNILYNYEYN